MRACLYTLLILLAPAGCKTGAVDPGNLDSSSPRDVPITWMERGTVVYDLGTPVDGIVYKDGPLSFDLTSTAGQPCTAGKCGDGLICMANVCRAICSTECGDTAPECAPTDGCHWVTSFSAACLPGSAKYPETCGGGVFCVGGNLCVNLGSKTMCLVLCKYGCPSGTYCGQTNSGCKICVPY